MLVIIEVDLRTGKEVTFPQTEQEPRIHLDTAITVFAGVFTARIVLVGAVSDAVEVFNYDKITKPATGMIEQPSYIAAGGTEHGYSNLSSGVGFLLTYDTRDIPANAYRGTYLDFRGMMYNKAFGSDDNFYRLEIDYRQYKTLGRRRVLAWTVQKKNVFGDVPLTKYALSGTPFDLRGYFYLIIFEIYLNFFY